MNKRQNAGEKCIYSMWILQRISQRRDIPRYQKQQFNMYYYIVFGMYFYIAVLKNLAKFTRTHLHRSLFSIWNLQLHWNRDIGTYRFLWVLRKFFWTLLLWKSSCELVLKGKNYKKWQTNILIIIKIYREVDSFFEKTDIVRESVYLKIYIYNGSVLRCSFQWFCLCIFHRVKELISCKYSI